MKNLLSIQQAKTLSEEIMKEIAIAKLKDTLQALFFQADLEKLQEARCRSEGKYEYLLSRVQEFNVIL